MNRTFIHWDQGSLLIFRDSLLLYKNARDRLPSSLVDPFIQNLINPRKISSEDQTQGILLYVWLKNIYNSIQKKRLKVRLIILHFQKDYKILWWLIMVPLIELMETSLSSTFNYPCQIPWLDYGRLDIEW